MRFIFVVEPDRFESIKATVLKALPSAKIDRIETSRMWPEMQVTFFHRELDTVVDAVKRATALPELKV